MKKPFAFCLLTLAFAALLASGCKTAEPITIPAPIPFTSLR